MEACQGSREGADFQSDRFSDFVWWIAGATVNVLFVAAILNLVAALCWR